MRTSALKHGERRGYAGAVFPPARGGTVPLRGAVEPADTTHEPRRLADWTELHRAIAAMPDEEREAFDLLRYHELPQAEAAAMLGVSERTLRRRWRAARRRLGAAWLGAVSP